MAYDIAFSPAPRMELLDDIFDEKVGGHDTWITEEVLDVDRCCPSIPSRYAKEQQQERAVYVTGVPHEWQNEAFELLVKSFGTVERVPCLISLGSEHTFRWAIMATSDDAENLMERMHGMMFQGVSLTTSMATTPGRTVHLLTPVAPVHGIPTPPYTPQYQGLGAYDNHSHPSLASTDDSKAKENVPQLAAYSSTLAAKPRSISKEFIPSPQAPEFAPSSSRKPSLYSGLAEFSTTEEAPSRCEAATPTIVTTSPPFVPLATSWANIASAANPSTNVVELYPVRSTSRRLNSIGRIPAVVRTERAATPESQADQMRVVFLLNLPNNLTLSDISNGIQEGPLVQIAFGFDEVEKKRYAGVVFQYARDAEMFHQVLQKERAESRPERFRFIMDAVRGDAFPAEEMIKAMSDSKIGATRRLTMVKKGFFFVLTERRLTNLCNKIAGEDNVQLVWLYNGGNATVVFSNVGAAMKMKAELDRMTAGAGSSGGQPAVWEGLQTTYSKDPCVVPLVLTTALSS